MVVLAVLLLREVVVVMVLPMVVVLVAVVMGAALAGCGDGGTVVSGCGGASFYFFSWCLIEIVLGLSVAVVEAMMRVRVDVGLVASVVSQGFLNSL